MGDRVSIKPIANDSDYRNATWENLITLKRKQRRKRQNSTRLKKIGPNS